MSSKEFLRSAAAFVLAVILLMASAFAVDGLFSPGNKGGEADLNADSQQEETESPARLVELSLRQDGEHTAYISGYETGKFKPAGNITRAEAANMLYGLLSEIPELPETGETENTDKTDAPAKPGEKDGEADPAEKTEAPVQTVFADVKETDWFKDAIELLAAGGIIEGKEDGLVYPREEITRGEFAAMVSRFFPDDVERECAFGDVPAEHPYYEHIAKAAEKGWINGYEDGSFKPDDTINRAEAVTVLNRVLGRKADISYLNTIILPLFSDLTPDYWAYGEIMEAALSHSGEERVEINPETGKEIHSEYWAKVDVEPLRREPGQLVIGQELYYISEETGLPVTDTTVGSLYFGKDGRYTSGDAEIDGYVKETLAGICTAEMTQEEKLHAAYNYTRDGFTYLRRNYYDRGYTDWALEEARIMFQTKRGNCYCYAGVFYYLSRQLGYDSRLISGGVGWSERPHGWVEIDEDGVEYIYDTELEMSYRVKGNYQYDFYRMAYADVPWPYKK